MATLALGGEQGGPGCPVWGAADSGVCLRRAHLTASGSSRWTVPAAVGYSASTPPSGWSAPCLCPGMGWGPGHRVRCSDELAFSHPVPGLMTEANIFLEAQSEAEKFILKSCCRKPPTSRDVVRQTAHGNVPKLVLKPQMCTSKNAFMLFLEFMLTTVICEQRGNALCCLF